MPKITTARYRRCGKVMFPQASVSHSVHGGEGVLTPTQIHAPAYSGIRLTSGRYASYWNAFLFFLWKWGMTTHCTLEVVKHMLCYLVDMTTRWIEYKMYVNFSDVYDLEGVTFHSQSMFYRNKPATVAFSAEVNNVKPDGGNIPAASGGGTNFALKVLHHSLLKTKADRQERIRHFLKPFCS